MKMVKQAVNETGCGVAVFAMLTGRSFDEALTHLLQRRGEWISQKNHHMTVKQMKAAMAAVFGEQVVQVRGGAFLEPWCAVYVVYQERYRHWLAWDGAHFFDPLSTEPSRTIRRKITRVVTSGGPGRLNARAIS